MKIKPHKYHKSIRVSIDLDHFIKECENNDLHWFLKLFGTYKLRDWFNRKIKDARKVHEK